MFHKFFPSKRHYNGAVHDGSIRTETLKKNASQKFDKSKIRLVILADSDKGRTPFFDSNAIKVDEDVEKKTPSRFKSAPKAVNKSRGCSSSNDSGTPTKEGVKYRFLKLGSDVKVLEEMMFGTAPMAFKGSSLKVHVLRSPHNLMVTKVFVPEKPKGESLSDSEPDSMSLVNSMMDLSSGESFSIRKYQEASSNKSRPVDVPTPDLSDYGTDDDNGFASFTSSGSLPSSFPSPSNNSLSSHSSLHKRWMRSQTTSFKNHQRKLTLESSLSSQGSTKRRRQKLSIAILFGSHDEKDEASVNLFQTFVFSHFTLIESHVEKLRSVIEKAYFNLKTFLDKTLKALDEFRHDIYNLYMAPRLPDPVWLTMMSSSMHRPQLCEQFMKEFSSLVTQFDKKEQKFFVSSLLSAVLTQHLTWVATVIPAGGSPTSTYLEKHSAKWVDTLAKTHPYNPLWAQLGDLFGAIGPPLKIARTVVVGKKADLVKRFLYILSYFIRCSDVHERENPCSLRQILSDPPLEDSLSPSASEKTVVTNVSSNEDRNSLQSPVCSQQASCSSNGTSVFTGSHGIEAINMVSLESSMNASGSEQTTSFYEEAGTQREPKVVYCDNNLKDAVLKESNSKQTVIKSDSMFDGYDVNSTQRDTGDPQENKNVMLDQPQRQREQPLNHKPPQNLNLDDSAASEMDNLSKAVFFEPLQNSLISASPSTTCVNGKSPLPETVEKHKPVCDSKLGLSELDNSKYALSELHTFQPSNTPVCSLTPLSGPKTPIIENVQHVRKHAEPSSRPEEFVQRSQSFSEGKPISRLSQQLENNSNSKAINNDCKPTSAELRKLYITGGTSSMFDEYYESGTEAKPMDDVSRTAPSLSRMSSVENGKDVKSSLTRMLSIQDNNKSLSAKSSNGTCRRPKTPEMSRRRHYSSTSSMEYDAYDPLSHGKEVKLPFVFSDSSQFNVQTFDRNFGRSLLAGFSEKYMSDFVLLGTSDKSFKEKLLNDLQTTVQSSFLDEHIEEAVCVIADTDTWTVEVASSKIMKTSPSGCTTWSYSKLVADLIESVVGIHKLKMGAEFCLMHLEDRLQEIYFKSFMLAEYLQDPYKFSQQELTSMLGFENSDMSLLFAVAGTHTPSLLTGS